MLRIARTTAFEILDSRSRPTLLVGLTTTDGIRVRAGVPAGASTGSREAVEVRDGDPERFGGQGVRTAAGHVEGEISETLAGRMFSSFREVDQALCELDGTGDKSRLGANAVVGVSLAAARADARSRGMPLWERLAEVAEAEPRLPVPHFNVVNGGAHAQGALDFQEFMVAPRGAGSLPEAVRAGSEIHGHLKSLLSSEGYTTGLGDEGGFAPALGQPEDALDLLVAAIAAAGHTPDRQEVALALDPAASELRHDGGYRVGGAQLDSDALIERYVDLVGRYPVWSLEDGLAEDDTDGWKRLTERLGGTVQLVGDDNFVTSPTLIAEAIDQGVANAALIKVNQIGTVSEALDAVRLCRDAGYGCMVSHRSGETTDDFLADLAVGTGCGQFKSGAPARGERLAKYNRLLEISRTAPDLPYGPG
ncbi:phosphopyruvate hydratase [Streptomyces xiaopingdaonensis]|uniref:phosphopyruvate hydratase n=1 Tax=Streptomyces xiaopingdaonensis TaxID=1565415 RepID=UPI00031ACD83|nr:phosphopyruvate hydratase [Streptomyces xiaopingdaonensis]